MRDELHDWVALQIERSLPGVADATAVPRLADAAAALLHPASRRQVFGLEPPPGGISEADELAERCLDALRTWAPMLDARASEALALQLRDLGLPPITAAPAPSAPVLELHVFVGTSVADVETGETVEDPSVIERIGKLAHGAPERSETSLVDVPCIEAVVSDERGRWATDGRADLLYDDEQRALRCRLVFDLVREPTPEELSALFDAIENELFFTGWGMILEWDFERPKELEELSVHTDTEILAHRLLPIASS
ncbi:MAG TPA: hypothetical protein VIL20_04465 [Sandaracinaceae bacterium]